MDTIDTLTARGAPFDASSTNINSRRDFFVKGGLLAIAIEKAPRMSPTCSFPDPERTFPRFEGF